MNSLARVTDTYGKNLFFNPDHVRLVYEGESGTEIIFIDGTKVTAKETVKAVVDEIQAHSS